MGSKCQTSVTKRFRQDTQAGIHVRRTLAWLRSCTVVLLPVFCTRRYTSTSSSVLGAHELM